MKKKSQGKPWDTIWHDQLEKQLHRSGINRKTNWEYSHLGVSGVCACARKVAS